MLKLYFCFQYEKAKNCHISSVDGANFYWSFTNPIQLL